MPRVDWAKARAATRALVVKHFLVICFAVATILAITWPQPGRAVAGVLVLGDVHLIQTINICIVFLISGLVLKTDDIKKAAKHWQGVVFGFVSILLLTPCLGFALRELPLTPPEFAIGLTIFAAVPTTLGVGEALVRASGGNSALALLLLVGTNMLGIATMPPILKLLLSGINEEGFNVSVDAVDLLVKLVVTVLVPAAVGKVVRELFQSVRTFVTKWKLQLGMCSNVQLALIIWQTLSGAQEVLLQQRFTDILIVIVAAALMHLVYLALNFTATSYLLHMPLRESIAVGIMTSQKSAPVAVTVISYLTTNVAQQGLLAVPCISGQLLQIFMGAAFAPFLARRVQRQAAAAKADTAAAAEGGEGGGEGGGDGEATTAVKLEAGVSCSVEAKPDGKGSSDGAGEREGTAGEWAGEVELPTAGASVAAGVAAVGSTAVTTEAAAGVCGAAGEAGGRGERGRAAAEMKERNEPPRLEAVVVESGGGPGLSDCSRGG